MRFTKQAMIADTHKDRGTVWRGRYCACDTHIFNVIAIYVSILFREWEDPDRKVHGESVIRRRMPADKFIANEKKNCTLNNLTLDSRIRMHWQPESAKSKQLGLTQSAKNDAARGLFVLMIKNFHRCVCGAIKSWKVF